MFEEPLPGGQVSAQTANAPNLSYTATPVFGNMNFTITAPETAGRVERGFPTLSYLSIESLIFFQNISQPNTNPTLSLSGSNSGQQKLSGQVTQPDATGLSRVSTGTSLSASS